MLFRSIVMSINNAVKPRPLIIQNPQPKPLRVGEV